MLFRLETTFSPGKSADERKRNPVNQRVFRKRILTAGLFLHEAALRQGKGTDQRKRNQSKDQSCESFVIAQPLAVYHTGTA
ncbi:MAG TPA: hypothetical protein VKH81_24460 [Candidatus Angelobacter sp.]|nr:hypothetical protein [Candidatus Angelobacter sp.]